MKTALIQLAYGDDETPQERTERVVELVRAQQGHDLVVLPELWPAGGFSHSLWPERAQSVDGDTAQRLSAVAKEIGAVVHAGSIVERGPQEGPEGKDLWNTSLVFDTDGERIADYRKIHRFGFAGGEPKLMEAGEELVTFRLHGVVTGLATCYDLRFPELFREYVDQGAQVMLVPAAWPAARVDAWRTLLRARAMENQTWMIACNTAGTHAKTPMGGYSAVVAPTGEVVVEAGEGEEVLSVDVDLGLVEQTRESFPVLDDRRM